MAGKSKTGKNKTGRNKGRVLRPGLCIDQRHYFAAEYISSTCSQLMRLSQNASRYFGRALR